MTDSSHRVIKDPTLPNDLDCCAACGAFGDDLARPCEADDATRIRLDDAKLRKRWHARDDAEELYLRRCSELSTHQMLDGFGVPHGELSLNGRLAWLEKRLREPDVAPRLVRIEAPLTVNVADLTEAYPADEWTIASSELSIDAGPIRLRCEGGSYEERTLLMKLIAAMRAAAMRGDRK